MRRQINGTYLTALAVASPLLLIHGYGEDASVWDQWVKWLKADNITDVTTVTFQDDDQCGTVKQHAEELSHIVNGTVNMIVHSKAGLDARAYIAQNPGTVANLVMIATPNLGTPAAYMDLTECSQHGSAGLADLQPGSAATQVRDVNSTNYYTVAGNHPVPCFISTFRPMCYVVDNDGFVTVESAKSHYQSLGIFDANHNDLLKRKDVYQRVLPVIHR